MINRTQVNINNTVALYRSAFKALTSLTSDTSWQQEHSLYALRDADNCGPTPQADEVEILLEKNRRRKRQERAAAAQAAGQPVPQLTAEELAYEPPPVDTSQEKGGRYNMSWIWRGRDASALEKEDGDYWLQLRAEWAQMDAHHTRWEEEKMIVKQEMYRTVLSLRHRWQTWTARVWHI
jgi:hypothetical protein